MRTSAMNRAAASTAFRPERLTTTQPDEPAALPTAGRRIGFGRAGAAGGVDGGVLLPTWLNHRLAALAGLLLALLTAAGAAAFLKLERDAQLAQEHRSARLMARVLEDHATRSEEHTSELQSH